MNEGTIKRVSYQLSIFGVLKPLIPIGFNVRQISEIEHDSELRHPPHPPKKGELEALRGRIGEHKTKDGKALFSVAALKADSKRLTLVFDSSEPVSANLIQALQKTLDCGFEIYLASSSFRFGVFVRTSEILVWEAE